MDLFKALNIGLSFLLELLMLAAFGYWGFQTGTSTLIRVVLGIGTPLLAIIIWGIYNAPRSARRLARNPRLLLELFMFSLAALALAAAGQPAAALIFAIFILINLSLAYIWQQ